MTDLRSWYLDRLSTWVQSLEGARTALTGGDPEAAQAVRRIAHSLRGSGASFGFPAITRAAALLEESQPSRLREPLEALLETLREVAAGGAGTPARLAVVAADADTAAAARGAGERGGWQTVVIPSDTGVVRAVEDAQAALLVLDLVLPTGDGRNLLVAFRDHPDLAGLPIIIVAPPLGEAPRRECLALGADEYLEKPVSLEMLAKAITSAQQRARDRLDQADRDPVTGAWNRAAFAQAYQRLVDATPLTMAILDLDDLEVVNKAQGFEAGNDVMRRAVALVQETLRSDDVLARLRGDEFAVLFPRTGPEAAVALLEHAQGRLARTPVLESAERPLHLGFCAGVSAVVPNTSPEEATTDIERFLYLAKRRGPGSIVSSEEGPSGTRRTVVLAEDDPVTATLIRHRLQREGFEVRHFRDGSGALTAVNDDVALFVLDVKMPGLDGFTVLRQLRANPRLAKVPILMLTAMGREEDIVRGFSLGASDYVTKPFSPAELLARIRRLLK